MANQNMVADNAAVDAYNVHALFQVDIRHGRVWIDLL